MFLVYTTSLNPCRQDTAPLAPHSLGSQFVGLNPSTLIMERDQDFPQLPSIPLSSKLDGALTPLCFPSIKAGTKSQSHALARLGSASGWAQRLLASFLPHWHKEVPNLSELC